MTIENRLLTMIEPLCSWYEENQRSLPWRDAPSPYNVWISEIMLQQTRVEAVKPYFYRFIKRLPNVEALAQIEEDELLKLWEGLGYYSRARNLKKAANVCMEEYEGRLPDSYEKLLKLPGIGTYTAGAIASIAYHIPVPAVDGNVLRVVSRVIASKEDISSPKVKKYMEQLLQNVIKKQKSFDVGILNQALMELGAIVCIPNGAPLCEQCPLKQCCLAYHLEEKENIPYKAPKKPRRIEEKTIFLVHANEKTLLHKRSEKGLLAGMYELPNTEGTLKIEEVKEYWNLMGKCEMEKIQERGNGKHIFTHVQWNMIGYEVWLSKTIELGDDWIWATQEQIEKQYSIPSAFGFMMGKF